MKPTTRAQRAAEKARIIERLRDVCDLLDHRANWDLYTNSLYTHELTCRLACLVLDECDEAIAAGLAKEVLNDPRR